MSVLVQTGKTIATASWDKTVRIWDAAIGSLIKTFNDYSDRVLSVSFSPDGKTIATAGYENTIAIWDIETGARKNTLTIEYGQNLCVSYSPNGKTIASGGGGLKLWNASAGILRKELIPRSVIDPVIFSPDGKTIAGGSLRGTIYFLDMDAETVKNTISGHTRYIKSMSFSPDGKTIAIVNKDDNTFQLWDVETSTFLKTVGGDAALILTVSFSPDGSLIASGDYHHKSVKLWNAATGKLKKHSLDIQKVFHVSPSVRMAKQLLAGVTTKPQTLEHRDRKTQKNTHWTYRKYILCQF